MFVGKPCVGGSVPWLPGMAAVAKSIALNTVCHRVWNVILCLVTSWCVYNDQEGAVGSLVFWTPLSTFLPLKCSQRLVVVLCCCVCRAVLLRVARPCCHALPDLASLIQCCHFDNQSFFVYHLDIISMVYIFVNFFTRVHICASIVNNCNFLLRNK